MRGRSTFARGLALAAALAVSGCAEFYPYVDPTVRSSDYLFRHRLDRGETRMVLDRSPRRDECNRLHDLSQQPTRQALCYVDAKHDEIVSNIRAYTWGHRILSLGAAGAAVGAVAVGIFGGSRDLATGLGLGAASAYGLDSIVNVPAYARSYWAGIRGLQCVRGTALEALATVSSLAAIRYELIRYQRALRDAGQLSPARTAELDRLFGRIRSLQVDERSNAVGIVQAADRIIAELNRQVALNEPSTDRIMQIARGISPAGQQLGGIAPPEATAEDPGVQASVDRATETVVQRLQAGDREAVSFVDTRLREIDEALPTRLVVSARIQDCRLGGENEFRINPDIDSVVIHPGETYRFVVSGGQGSASAALSGSVLSGVRLVPSQALGAGSFELIADRTAAGRGEAIAVFQDQSGQNQRSVVVRVAPSAPGRPPTPPRTATPPTPPTPCTASALAAMQPSEFERTLSPTALQAMAQRLGVPTPTAIDAAFRTAICRFQLRHNAENRRPPIQVTPGRIDQLTAALLTS